MTQVEFNAVFTPPEATRSVLGIVDELQRYLGNELDADISVVVEDGSTKDVLRCTFRVDGLNGITRGRVTAAMARHGFEERHYVQERKAVASKSLQKIPA